MSQLNFPEMVKNIFKSGLFDTNKLSLKPNEYMSFWTTLLSNQENLYFFIHELIQQIISLESTQQCTSKNYSLQSLISTFFIAILHGRSEQIFEADKSQIMAAWDAHLNKELQNKKLQFNPYSDSIIKCIRIYGQSTQTALNQFLMNLIGQICFLPDISSFKIDSHSNDNQLNEEIRVFYQSLYAYQKTLYLETKKQEAALIYEQCENNQTGQLSFAYDYLVNQVFLQGRKNLLPTVIFESIVKYFKALPHVSQQFPNQAERSALSLLHFTKQIITYYSTTSMDSLKHILNQAQLYRRWPHPVGTMAQELVTLIFSQCQSIGNAFRNKIRQEIPALDLFELDDEQNEGGNKQESKQQYQEEKEINVDENDPKYRKKMFLKNLDRNAVFMDVYLIADEESPEAAYIYNILKQQFEANKLNSLHLIRCLMVINMLTPFQKDDIQPKNYISILKPNYVFNIYCRLINIIEICDDLDSLVDVRLIQENAFEELFQDIKGLKEEEKSSDNIEIYNYVNDHKITFIPDYPYPCYKLLIKFPQLSSRSMSMLKSNSSMNYNINHIHGPKSLVQIESLFQKYDTHPIQSHLPPMKFLVMGGDIELHHLVQQLGVIYQDNPLIFKTLDLRVYLVPSKKNTLASFIALKDCWYNRNLYRPFVEDLCVPKFENVTSESDKNQDFNITSDGGFLKPFQLKANLIQTYLREANRGFNVRVYECVIQRFSNQGVGGGGENKRTYETQKIYFCQYIEVGVTVETQQFRNDKSHDQKNMQTLSHYELIEKNPVQFTFHEIGIKISGVDFMGNQWSKNEQEEKQRTQVHSLQINNVYKPFFEGNMPYPNAHWLEMSYITYENSQIFDTNIKQKTIFQNHRSRNIKKQLFFSQSNLQLGDQIQSAFRALHTNIPVSHVTLAMEKEKGFDMMIDGKIITGVHQAIIGPVVLDQNPQLSQQAPDLSIPIMTFLPLKL